MMVRYKSRSYLQSADDWIMERKKNKLANVPHISLKSSRHCWWIVVDALKIFFIWSCCL